MIKIVYNYISAHVTRYTILLITTHNYNLYTKLHLLSQNQNCAYLITVVTNTNIGVILKLFGDRYIMKQGPVPYLM